MFPLFFCTVFNIEFSSFQNTPYLSIGTATFAEQGDIRQGDTAFSVFKNTKPFPVN